MKSLACRLLAGLDTCTAPNARFAMNCYELLSNSNSKIGCKCMPRRTQVDQRCIFVTNSYRNTIERIIMPSLNKISLIAPCGMNCAICTAYLREKNKCPGCRAADIDKPVTRVVCKIKTCELLPKAKSGFCFQCDKFPCERLKHLDKRYRTNYAMSMIENLENIRRLGIRRFLVNEKTRWACPECGGTICVHKRYCYSCRKKG